MDTFLPRIPQFWSSKPAAWLTLAEAQFSLAGITKASTKFYYLLEKLGADVIDSESDITQPPDPTPSSATYNKLCSELVKRYSISDVERRSRFQNAKLDGLRPSQLLRNLRQFAGADFTENYVFETWFLKLPEKLQLAVGANLPSNETAAVNDAFAEKVDRVFELLGLKDICSTVDEYEFADEYTTDSTVSSVSYSDYYQPHQPFRYRRPSSYRPALTYRRPAVYQQHTSICNQPFVCYYHIKFGNTAQKCKSGCVLYPRLGIQDSICVIDPKSKISKILIKYPNITKKFNCNKIQHNVEHFITTSGPPTFARPRRLAPDRLKHVKEHFDQLLKAGILRPSSSNYASPLHIVLKKDGTLRPCGDYRTLNNQTLPDRYPIPFLTDFVNNLHNCKVFSVIDLQKAYHQIPVRAEDIPKTAITTPFGLFEYTTMPFGLRNAAQTFQRFMSNLTRDLSFVFVYIDDVLVASESQESHLAHLDILLKRFDEAGLTINVDKSVFFRDEVKFLGHIVNKHGIAPSPDKVKSILSIPKPQTDKEMKRFLGTVNFYRRFIKNCAHTLAPLTQRAEDKNILWTQEMTNAFDQAKSTLAEAITLPFPVPDAPYSLMTDASDTAAGAVLQQFVNNGWRPLAFFSKKFSKAEQKYAAFDRELAAVYKAIRHFDAYLEGRKFFVQTDHLPLVKAFKSTTERKSARQIRQMAFVSEFTTDIRHVKGSKNPVADALSRVEVSTIDLLDQLVQGQTSENKSIQDLQRNPSLTIEQVLFNKPSSGTNDEAITLWCENSKNEARPIVPVMCRKQIFDDFHKISHPGNKATQKLISARYFWHGMNKDIANWCKHCIPCQASKIGRHTKIAPTQIKKPSNRFSHVHIDIVGPLPECEGSKYVLTMIDRFSLWVEALPIKDIKTETVAKGFCNAWVQRFGVPDMLTTDRGTQFQSSLFKELCTILNTKQISTSAYNPRANGLVERFHRQLKASIKAADTTKWTEVLPFVLLGIRSTVKLDIGYSSAQMVYGQSLNLPSSMVEKKDLQTFHQFRSETTHDLIKHMQEQRPTETRVTPSSNTYVPEHLKDCDYVFVRKEQVLSPLEKPYLGPCKVIEKRTHTFAVLVNGRQENISIQRLKPAWVDATESFQEFLPRGRGRPRIAALEGGLCGVT